MMLGLIGLLLLILLRVSSRALTAAGTQTPGIATEQVSSTPDPQIREAGNANESGNLAA
jgi:hypothetical protein